VFTIVERSHKGAVSGLDQVLDIVCVFHGDGV
jgi:hypothetical protein